MLRWKGAVKKKKIASMPARVGRSGHKKSHVGVHEAEGRKEPQGSGQKKRLRREEKSCEAQARKRKRKEKKIEEKN